MKVLITGIGNVGKSSFREKLRETISCEDFDFDYHEPLDFFQNDKIYILEDVRGTTEKAAIPIQNFDLIIYILPGFLTHLTFWISRFWHWFATGKGGITRENGWRGNNHKYDLRNIPVFLPEAIRNLQNRNKWIKEDLQVLTPFEDHVIFINSRWTFRGIRFSPTPSQIAGRLAK